MAVGHCYNPLYEAYGKNQKELIVLSAAFYVQGNWFSDIDIWKQKLEERGYPQKFPMISTYELWSGDMLSILRISTPQSRAVIVQNGEVADIITDQDEYNMDAEGSQTMEIGSSFAAVKAKLAKLGVELPDSTTAVASNEFSPRNCQITTGREGLKITVPSAAEITLYAASGRMLSSHSVPAGVSALTETPASGIYFISVKMNNRVETRRISIQ